MIRIGFDPMPAALKASNKPGAAPSTRAVRQHWIARTG